MSTTTQQESLFFEAPVKFKYRKVSVDEVLREPWGPPPDEALKRNVEATGLLFPVIFVQDNGSLRIREGRRRFQAMVAAGHTSVPGLVVQGDLGALAHILTLSGNTLASQNRVMDLAALEELMVATGEHNPVELARRSRVPLKDLRHILKLQGLNGELKDAWREGKFGNNVGVAAAKLESEQQDKLVPILKANDTLTMADIQEVKKVSVSSHQRSLSADNTKDRLRSWITSAKEEALAHWGDGELVSTLERALALLEEMSAE